MSMKNMVVAGVVSGVITWAIIRIVEAHERAESPAQERAEHRRRRQFVRAILAGGDMRPVANAPAGVRA